MRNVLAFNNKMQAQRLIRLAEYKFEVLVQFHWRCFSHSEDTVEPLWSIYKAVPSLVEIILLRKTS